MAKLQAKRVTGRASDAPSCVLLEAWLVGLSGPGRLGLRASGFRCLGIAGLNPKP